MTNLFLPLGDSIGSISLVDWMGGELEVVNDARVSYDNLKDALDARDYKLIKFLLNNNHTSPLRGTAFKFQALVPLYVCRQWYKHHVSSNFVDDQDGWNEKSYRYVKAEGDHCYVPTEFRKQSEDNRQASVVADDREFQEVADIIYRQAIESALDSYDKLIQVGVCREQARGILPQSVYTRFRWTCSLHGVVHFINLRDSSHAQWEIQQYAKAVKALIDPIAPTIISEFK
jgi:thymidylate synthase (FAD)